MYLSVYEQLSILIMSEYLLKTYVTKIQTVTNNKQIRKTAQKREWVFPTKFKHFHPQTNELHSAEQWSVRACLLNIKLWPNSQTLELLNELLDYILHRISYLGFHILGFVKLRQSSDLIGWFDSSHGTLYMLNWNKLLSLNKLLILSWTDSRVGLTLWYMYGNSCLPPVESLP